MKKVTVRPRKIFFGRLYVFANINRESSGTSRASKSVPVYLWQFYKSAVNRLAANRE